jgi:glycosyltransferase involved in cell wall biosynthesis
VKILIVTPMLPPALGGPAVHAEKISDFFSKDHIVKVISFETVLGFPAGVRHIVFLFKILVPMFRADIVFAFDGFSVAVPSVFLGRLLGKKVVLRIGGDLVHEQFVEQQPVDMKSFYDKINSEGEGFLTKPFKKKLALQRYALKNATAVIFTTTWQRDIYTGHYTFPKEVFVINNPAPAKDVQEDATLDKEKVFLMATRDAAFKNHARVKTAFEKVKNIHKDIVLDTDISEREQLLNRLKKSRGYLSIALSDISPNTVLDALSVGTPIIMTKNTGFYEVLKDSGAVRFVDPFSENEIEKALLEFCDDSLWQIYRTKAKEYIWPTSWTDVFREYDLVIKKVCTS